MKAHTLALTVAMLTFPHVGPVAADTAKAPQTLAALPDGDGLQRRFDTDGPDRMRLANRLTMLTQRVAAASCALNSDVAPGESHGQLDAAMKDIDITLAALRTGSDALNIHGPETNERILQDIASVDAAWQQTHGAVVTVLQNGPNMDSAYFIADQNADLLDKATVLSSNVVGQYAHPFEVTQADAMLISIAGRQRMLTQKMAKSACEIWSGKPLEQARAELTEAMGLFETSLNALRFGMPAAGIQAAPNEDIRAGLDDVLTRWGGLRGELDALLGGADLTSEQKAGIMRDLDLELQALEGLVHAYNLYVERTQNG